MAGSPEWKVFRNGEYVACTKYAEDAAALASIFGNGAEVRHGHGKKDRVWYDGTEEFSAGESYDGAARIMIERVNARARAYARLVGRPEATR